MARLFDDAQSEYLERNEAVLSATPLAMVCWFNCDDDASNGTVMNISRTTRNDWWRLRYSSMPGGTVKAEAAENALGASAVSTSGRSTGTWHHACGIFASATDRRAFIDGGSKGTNTDDYAPAGVNVTNIGCQYRFSAEPPRMSFVSGKIAEAAIYDLSNWPGATASDKADAFEKILPSLAKGFTPLHFPLGLVAYWPLIRSVNV